MPSSVPRRQMAEFAADAHGNAHAAECDPFHDMSFDRAKWVGIARLVNTFHLSRKPAIDLEVNGFFQSGAIQGTFDINPLGSADAA